MKTETTIEAEIRRQREKLRKLKREREAVKRRRLAQERAELERCNCLLGWAVSEIFDAATLKKLHGRLGQAKPHLVHPATKRPGEIAMNESDFQKVMAYLLEIAGVKEVSE